MIIEFIKKLFNKRKKVMIDLSTAPRGVRNNNPGNIDDNPLKD